MVPFNLLDLPPRIGVTGWKNIRKICVIIRYQGGGPRPITSFFNRQAVVRLIHLPLHENTIMLAIIGWRVLGDPPNWPAVTGPCVAPGLAATMKSAVFRSRKEVRVLYDT